MLQHCNGIQSAASPGVLPPAWQQGHRAPASHQRSTFKDHVFNIQRRDLTIRFDGFDVRKSIVYHICELSFQTIFHLPHILPLFYLGDSMGLSTSPHHNTPRHSNSARVGPCIVSHSGCSQAPTTRLSRRPLPCRAAAVRSWASRQRARG